MSQNRDPRAGRNDFSLFFRRSSQRAGGAALLVFLTGCIAPITGDWHMIRSAPNRETFAIDAAHFARDGTYKAAVTLDGRTLAETGAYDFNGFKLTLKPSGGGSRSYNAVRRISELELRDGTRYVVLEKGPK